MELSSSKLDISSFYDLSNTFEYKIKMCDTGSGVDKHLINDAIS
jgi:hypothetical protein